eukprot:3477765-Ditylum_brightwellii.AAC.1
MSQPGSLAGGDGGNIKDLILQVNASSVVNTHPPHLISDTLEHPRLGHYSLEYFAAAIFL